MTQYLYCLECQAVVGEVAGVGEGGRGAGALTCQSCAQHGDGYPGGSGEDAGSGWPSGRVGRTLRSWLG